MTLRLDNYRTSTEYKEILRILQKASSKKENFFWQTYNKVKSVVPINHFEIDFVAREVVLYFNQDQHQLMSGLPLYIKLDYRDTVFKITDYLHRPSSLHFSFPDVVKTKELRVNPRFDFSKDKSKSKFVGLRATAGPSSGMEINVRLLNISYFGLGILVSEQNRSFLKNNRILWITRLEEMELSNPILTEVVYITNENNDSLNKERLLRVGLKLSGVFPHEVFDEIFK